MPLPKTQQATLDALTKRLEGAQERMIGFPVADFDYSELYPFLSHMINNIGDPYVPAAYSLHTKDLERSVVQFFAKLFRADPGSFWGYVTNGGTEGNLYSLYLARELFPGALVYHSEAVHYSVQKNLHVLGMPSVCVRTKPNGEIDYDDLWTLLGQHRDRPAILFANIGTTMTEAKDNVATFRYILKSLAIRDAYIHCDAALSGIPTALIRPHHPFDFTDGADSISISGHKFIGSPFPSGVVLVRKNYRNRIGRMVSYIDSPDTTISGSRSGHAALFLWYAVQHWGVRGFRTRAAEGVALAEYTLQQLQARGWEAWRNPGALTVVLKSPSAALRKKWQLATQNGWSHVICMPGITRTRIDEFLADIDKEPAKTPAPKS